MQHSGQETQPLINLIGAITQKWPLITLYINKN